MFSEVNTCGIAPVEGRAESFLCACGNWAVYFWRLLNTFYAIY